MGESLNVMERELRVMMGDGGLNTACALGLEREQNCCVEDADGMLEVETVTMMRITYFHDNQPVA